MAVCFLPVRDSPQGNGMDMYQQASSFGDKGQLVRGGAPLNPHMKGWILYV
ncbi:hypothetical protein HMPREF0262_01049 [Clostridium sp. ATCC 29733]|nr:hypothetical protein HMPREF0262_01049 [Clostridium sp. ATCC 29733]